MSIDLSRKYVIVAFAVVIMAAAVLGMAIESTTKPVQTSNSVSAPYADVTLAVHGDLALGPDNQTHDAFVPCNFTVYAGQIVNLTVFNYDTMPHSFTSTTLNVNFQIPESTTNGVPSIGHFQFNAAQAGVYRWWCALPCDSDAGGWAMTTGNDGQPGQIGYMGGFVTVLN